MQKLAFTMNSKWNHIEDLFKRYYTKTSQYYTMTKSILLPMRRRTKKDSENENEYNCAEITRNEIKPYYFLSPYSSKTWDNIVNKWYLKNMNLVITYNDIFKV